MWPDATGGANPNPTHRKGDLLPCFLFACAISSCIIRHGCISLQKQLLLQLYAARQIPERGREDAAADTCSMLQEERASSGAPLFSVVAGAMGAYALAACSLSAKPPRAA